MAIGDVLPKEYRYVVIVVVFYCVLNFWMAFQVGGARKRYKVAYPTLYATESENKDAKLFNCVRVSNPFLPSVFFHSRCET
ncbi:hypothetical protein DY000_02058568 [Brassica cretica]|uniref:Uncharacterized protein n=1 Tax=Brassica cretica TaxID=69181 RepID=A0ABQ7ASJ3_BRACR|nr:hypothetical protein DY000_02058568 [Brassica cretica]